MKLVTEPGAIGYKLYNKRILIQRNSRPFLAIRSLPSMPGYELFYPITAYNRPVTI